MTDDVWEEVAQRKSVFERLEVTEDCKEWQMNNFISFTKRNGGTNKRGMDWAVRVPHTHTTKIRNTQFYSGYITGRHNVEENYS
jgi:phosphoheptose isomerase